MLRTGLCVACQYEMLSIFLCMSAGLALAVCTRSCLFSHYFDVIVIDGCQKRKHTYTNGPNPPPTQICVQAVLYGKHILLL